MEQVFAETLVRGDSPGAGSTREAGREPAAASRRPGPGLAGYEVLGVLGRGGMGVVYKARQIALDRIVALKMIVGGGHAGAEELARFRTEAELIAHLAHPNLVTVYEIGQWEGGSDDEAVPYLAMEYVDGGSLEQYLAGQPQPPRQAAALAATLARALHAVHQRGIVHRDLKPANVLLSPASGAREPPEPACSPSLAPSSGDLRPPLACLVPKITDFGLAKRIESDSGLTHTGAILGTPAYMPPEQAAGHAHAVGPAADIYALGVILYQMLTGQPPFRGETAWQTIEQVLHARPASPRALVPGVPRDLETICLKCLEKDPKRRYLDARALADDLDRWLEGKPIEARATPLYERFLLWVRRQPAVAGLLGLVLLGVIAFASTAVVHHARLRSALETAEEHAEESRRGLVLLCVAHGSRALDEGDDALALLWFVEALRLDVPGGRQEQLHRIRIGTVLRQGPELKHLWLDRGRGRLVLFPPDGRRLLTATEHGQARLWDIGPGCSAGTPLPLPAAVRAGAFSPVADEVAIGCCDGTVRVHDLAGKRSWDLGGPGHAHAGAVTAVVHSGRHILTAGTDGIARLWDAGGQSSSRVVARHDGPILAADYLPRRGLVVTAGTDHTAQLWQDGTARALSLRHPGRVLCVCFAPSGDYLATGCADGGVRLWSLQGKLLLGPLRHRGAVGQVCFSPDGARLVSAGDDHTARLWDARSGEQLAVPLVHTSPVNSIAFSPDGRWVATGSDDDTARVWDAASGAPVSPRLRHNGSVLHVVFAPVGARRLLLATAANDGGIRLWDIFPARSALTPAALPQAAPAVPGRRWVSPDGRTVLTSDGDHDAQLRDARTGAALGPPLHHGSEVELALFLPDGRVVTGSDDNMARIWSVPAGDLLAPPLSHRGSLRYLAASADGRLLLTASADDTARVWDTATGQPLTPHLPLSRTVRAAAFTPDSSCLSAAEDDGRVQTWDLRPERRPLDDIERLARLLSGCRIDHRHGVLPLSRAELSELCRQVGLR